MDPMGKMKQPGGCFTVHAGVLFCELVVLKCCSPTFFSHLTCG